MSFRFTLVFFVPGGYLRDPYATFIGGRLIMRIKQLVTSAFSDLTRGAVQDLSLQAP
jgi:hypothetical protein